VALHDTDAYLVEAASAAESLPDPTLWNGRTHLLVNTGTATVVWSSIGATPFQQGGVNVATVSITRGQALQIQSDGTRWVTKSSGMRAFHAASGVSDGAGNVVFPIPAGLFAVAPVVTHAVETAITDVTECRVSARSATSVTFNVRRSPAVVILGISVLQVPIPAAGVTVHMVATPAGSTP
jgi:hypothetical protein